MEPPRPNLADILKSGVSNNQRINIKQQRILQQLQWRQVYQNRKEYEYFIETTPEKEIEGKAILSLDQIGNGEINGLGTGAVVWPAAHVLSKYLELKFSCSQGKSSSLMKDKSVCELGSGTGLVGFVAACLGAKVTLTDQQCILELLTKNLVKLNENVALKSLIKYPISIRELDWKNCEEFVDHNFDFLLVSDCVLPKLYPIEWLVQAIDSLMRNSTIALFSYEHRPYPDFDPRQEFSRLCNERDIIVNVIPLSEHHPLYCAEDIEIWEVKRRSCSGGLNGEKSHLSFAKSEVEILTWGEEHLHIYAILRNKLQVNITQSASLGIGGVLWPSSVISSRIILGKEFRLLFSNSSDKRLTAIDLGAGCGLTSLALSLAGFEVFATDKSNISPLLQENIRRFVDDSEAAAISHGPIKAAHVDWNDISSIDAFISEETINQVDCIVCSDCLYNTGSVQSLLEALDKFVSHCKDSECKVLVVNEMRTALEEFLYLARRWPRFDIEVQEILLNEPDLELVRTATELKIAPPIRCCVLSWRKTFPG